MSSFDNAVLSTIVQVVARVPGYKNLTSPW